MLSRNPAFKAACRDLGIEVRELSAGWLLELSYRGEKRLALGNHLGLNGEVAMLTMRDKVATATLLEAKGIPVIPEKLLSRNSTPPAPKTSNPNDAASSSLPEAYPVILKPNTGRMGTDVYLCKAADDYQRALNLLQEKYTDLALSPYEDAEREYRCFYLNGKIEFSYAKLRSPNDWRHNLAHGATAELIRDQEIEALALRAGNALKVGFATIDILETKTGPKVLELNSGVAVKHLLDQHPELLDTLIDLYKTALLLLFSRPSTPVLS